MNSAITTKTRIGIVGNGIAGSTLANLLRQKNFEHIQLFDKHGRAKQTRPCNAPIIIHPPALRSLLYVGGTSLHRTLAKINSQGNAVYSSYAGLKNFKGEVLRDYLSAIPATFPPSMITGYDDYISSMMEPFTLSAPSFCQHHYRTELTGLSYVDNSKSLANGSPMSLSTTTSTSSGSFEAKPKSLLATFSNGHKAEFDIVVATDGPSSRTTVAFEEAVEKIRASDDKGRSFSSFRVVSPTTLNFTSEPAVCFEGCFPSHTFSSNPSLQRQLDSIRSHIESSKPHTSVDGAPAIQKNISGTFYDFVADKRRVFFAETSTRVYFKVQVPLLSFVSNHPKAADLFSSGHVMTTPALTKLVDFAKASQTVTMDQSKQPRFPVTSTDRQYIRELSHFAFEPSLLEKASDDVMSSHRLDIAAQSQAISFCFPEANAGWISGFFQSIAHHIAHLNEPIDLTSELDQATKQNVFDPREISTASRVVFGSHRDSLLGWCGPDNAIDSSPNAGLVVIGSNANSFLEEQNQNASIAVEGASMLALAFSTALEAEASLGFALLKYEAERQTRTKNVRKYVLGEATAACNQNTFTKSVMPMMNSFFKYANADNLKHEYEAIYGYDPVYSFFNPQK